MVFLVSLLFIVFRLKFGIICILLVIGSICCSSGLWWLFGCIWVMKFCGMCSVNWLVVLVERGSLVGLRLSCVSSCCGLWIVLC